MDIGLDSPIFDESMVLKLFGGFLGFVALLYFGFDTILNLSPTLKAFLLLVVTTGFFVASDLVKGSILRAFLYVFSSFTYLSFMVYTIGKFSPGSGAIFASLVVSALLFLGLGHLRSEKELGLSKRQSKVVLVGIVLLIFAVGIFDSMGARPEYELELRDEVTIKGNQEFTVGTLTVRNDFVFSRNMELPEMEGCLKAGGDTRRIYDSIGRDGLIAGGETESFNLTDRIHARPESNISISGNYSVLERECPEDLEEGVLYVGIGSDTGLVEFQD